MKVISRTGRRERAVRKRGGMNVLCEVLMQTDVECASPADSVATAAQQMRQANIRFLPVCDRLGKVLGAVTDRDIAIRVVAEELPASTPVADIMTRNVAFCGAQDDIGKAEALMALNRQSRVICVDEAGRMEGLISLADIRQMIGSRFATHAGAGHYP